MSLIGPRPERPAFCAEFEKRIHGWHYRTMVTPGLSGLAQVTGGYDLLPKEKVVLDLWEKSGSFFHSSSSEKTEGPMSMIGSSAILAASSAASGFSLVPSRIFRKVSDV